jgi:hypothetical protein
MSASSSSNGAGYSGKPLAAKLDIKPGSHIAALNAPTDYAALVAPLPPDVTVTETTDGADVAFNLIHLFITEVTSLATDLTDLKTRIIPNGMIWVSWPKKSSGVATDVTEDIIRDKALEVGLVDVKVCAMDATWSALKLVIPVAARPSAARK